MTLAYGSISLGSRYRNEFFQNISYKVGNGAHVKFWKERWMGNNSLNDLYELAMMPAIRIPLAETRRGMHGTSPLEGTYKTGSIMIL